jgi:HEAT repeat protein
MKIKRINIFKPDKVFEAVINKKESYLLEFCEGRDGIRYGAIYNIAKKMKKYWGLDPENSKMSGFFLFQNEINSDKTYEKFYRCWLEFTNKKEYENDYPFKLMHKVDKSIIYVKDKDIKERFAIAFFKKNKEKKEKEKSRFWLCEPGETEIKIISQSVEKYYKIKDEPWVSKYRDRLLDELTGDEEIQKGRFLELDATKNEKDSDKQPISEKVLSIARNSKILILLGEAGSGKTTTLRHYFNECLTNLNPGTPRARIPVFIKLKRFKEHKSESPEKTLSNIILTTINNKLDDSSQITIDEVSLSNDFSFLFDGLDEITDYESYNLAIEQLQDLLSKIRNEEGSKVIISCRSRDYHDIFSQYYSYELNELEDFQIKNYLNDFLKIDIDKIFEEQFEQSNKVLVMARIPFLLHIMACIIEKHLNENTGNLQPQLLPQNKGALIKQFVEDICSDQSKLTTNTIRVPSNQRNRLLSLFAFDMLDCGNRGEYTCPAKIRNGIDDKYYKQTGTTANQITDIVLNSEKERLLKSDSAYGKVEFIHSLIRDYFAAYSISHLSKDELLKRIKEEFLEYTKWDETLSILVGIVDEKTSEAIIKHLAGIDPYFAAQCFPIAKHVDSKTEDRLINTLSVNLETHNLIPVLDKTIDAFVNLKSEKAFFPLIRLVEKGDEQAYVVCLLDTIVKLYPQRAVEPLIALLKKDHNELIHMFASYELGILGSKDAIEPLLLLLKKSKSENVCIEVAGALCQLLTEDTEDVILKLLDDIEDEETIQYASNILGEIGSNRAVKPLINLLKISKSIIVLESAADALCKINNIDVLNSLINLLENNNSNDTYRHASNALGVIGSKKATISLIKLMKRSIDENVLLNITGSLGEIRDKSAISHLVDLVEKNKTDTILRSTANALIKIGSKEAIKPLIELLIKNNEEQISYLIINILAELDSDKAVKPIIMFLAETECEDNIVHAISALGKLKSKEAVDVLVRLMKDNNEFTIISSVSEALCKIGSKKSVKPLIELMNSTEDKEILEHVIKTLGELGYKDAVKSLIALMKKAKDEGVLFTIIRALRDLRPMEAVNPLIALLEKNNSNLFIIGGIAEALGSIGSDKALNPIVKALKSNKFEDCDLHLLYLIANSLFKLGSIEAEKLFIRLLNECVIQHVLSDAIYVLCRMGSTDSVEHITSLMKRSSDKEIIIEASEALCILDSADSFESIVELMQSSNDTTVLMQTSKVVIHLLSVLPAQRSKDTITILHNKYESSEDTENREIIYKTIDRIKANTGRRYLKQLKGFP